MMEEKLFRIQYWIRSRPLFYRLTLAIRGLLAMGFIPTGMVKLLGYRFTTISTNTDVGAFFEVLYQSGLYWKFLGLAQVLAGLVVLIPSLSALGALIFLGIITNIFVITISYNFAYTPVVTFLMLLASIWLIIWDIDRFRGLLFNGESTYKNRRSIFIKVPLPQPTLENSYERAVYTTGVIAGILLFGMLRGLILPAGIEYGLLLICLICFIMAVVFALRNAKPIIQNN